MEREIQNYINKWRKRCYGSDIPDESPADIVDKVPSYKRICLAILNNDHALKSLGITPKKSNYYNILKRIELKEREMNLTIDQLTKLLTDKISAIEDVDEKVSALNTTRAALHEISPLKHHPVDFVRWEKSTQVEVNEYNPNAVAPPEMQLLYESILNDGYTMPIVAFQDNENFKIVDGFHRRETERRNKDISASTLGYIPLSTIRNTQTDESNRMASTIRHNRARGSHNIELMSQIVSELVEMGKGDPWICKHIGMSIDELLRMKQITGLASLFANKDFSSSWTADSEEDYEAAD
jgi:hypothetical protein